MAVVSVSMPDELLYRIDEFVGRIRAIQDTLTVDHSVTPVDRSRA